MPMPSRSASRPAVASTRRRWWTRARSNRRSRSPSASSPPRSAKACWSTRLTRWTRTRPEPRTRATSDPPASAAAAACAARSPYPTSRSHAERAAAGADAMTNIQWSDGAPIYRQLKERVIAMMLDGILKPGDALPSVRQVAAEYQLNPITVSRAYQELADESLVEKRRGLGMYVTEEAAKKLLVNERERFLQEEWPLVLERIQRLGLALEDLMPREQGVAR